MHAETLDESVEVSSVEESVDSDLRSGIIQACKTKLALYRPNTLVLYEFLRSIEGLPVNGCIIIAAHKRDDGRLVLSLDREDRQFNAEVPWQEILPS